MASKETALVPVNDYSVMQVDPEMMQDLLAENLQGESLSMWDLTKINVPTGGQTKWVVQNIDGSEDYLDYIEGIILDHKINRSYWKGAETGNNSPDGSPPDCSSPDGKRGFGDPGVGTPLYTYPDGESGPPAFDCSACPLSQFGSGRNGGQACKMTRPIFILRSTDMLPALIVAPPTSLNHVRNYFLDLFKAGKHFAGVVTRIGLVKESNANFTFSRLNFQMAGPLDGGQAEFMKAYGAQIRNTFSNEGARPLVTSNPATSDDDESDETEIPF